jgi:Zn-dependent peptidase ImmA (M78 family)
MRAQTETVRIFSAAGVKLELIQPSDNSGPVPFQFALVVMSGAHAERKSDPSYLMGRVVMTREGPSKVAYAYYDKVAEFAQQKALDSARVLGCVIAHEIGHLLLGYGAHSGDGIMRAPWSFVETYRIRAGAIAFSKEHAAAIRSRLAGPPTDQPGETPRAEPLEPLTIEVVTANQARIPRETVKRAEQVATRIFLAAGIRLEWTNTAPDSVEPYRESAQQLKIHIVPDSPMKQAGRRLGVAERLVDNSDRRAFVFYDRIVDLARLNGVDVAPILGHALAHEMGHVLLPYGSHTSQGIMREEWDRAQFEAIAKGLLTFTAQHTDLIRMRVQAMHGN